MLDYFLARYERNEYKLKFAAGLLESGIKCDFSRFHAIIEKDESLE